MKRVVFIYIAKGIGILLVVAGHNWIILASKGELYRIIYSFHIPLFFILAGIFFNIEKPLGLIIKEKFTSLLIPYFVTGILALVFSAIFIRNTTALSKELFGLIYATGPHLQWVNLWFLPNLFLVSILCWGCLQLFKHYHLQISAQVFIVTVFILIGWLTIRMFWGMEFIWENQPIKINGLPFSADIALLASAYFLIGYILQNWVKNPKNTLVIFIIASTLFIGLHLISNYTTDLNLRRYDMPVIATTLALAGSAMVLIFSKFIENIRIIGKTLAYLGRNSIVILLYHSFFQDILFSILAEYSKRFFYIGVITFLASVIGSIIVIEIINHTKLLQSIFKTSKYNL